MTASDGTPARYRLVYRHFISTCHNVKLMYIAPVLAMLAVLSPSAGWSANTIEITVQAHIQGERLPDRLRFLHGEKLDHKISITFKNGSPYIASNTVEVGRTNLGAWKPEGVDNKFTAKFVKCQNVVTRERYDVCSEYIGGKRYSYRAIEITGRTKIGVAKLTDYLQDLPLIGATMPLVRVSVPAIDYKFKARLYNDGDIRIWGRHDQFPSYDLKVVRKNKRGTNKISYSKSHKDLSSMSVLPALAAIRSLLSQKKINQVYMEPKTSWVITAEGRARQDSHVRAVDDYNEAPLPYWIPVVGLVVDRIDKMIYGIKSPQVWEQDRYLERETRYYYEGLKMIREMRAERDLMMHTFRMLDEVSSRANAGERLGRFEGRDALPITEGPGGGGDRNPEDEPVLLYRVAADGTLEYVKTISSPDEYKGSQPLHVYGDMDMLEYRYTIPGR